MAKFTKEEIAKKKQYSKDLFIKGFLLETISDITGVALSTLKKWSKDENFEGAKKDSMISLKEIRNIVSESFISMAKGDKPAIKPDEAAKYAAAFEKLSDKKKTLSYMFEAYDILTEAILKDIQAEPSKIDKKEKLVFLQRVRNYTDRVLTNQTNEILNDD